MEIGRHNCMASDSWPSLCPQFDQSRDWRSCLQWNQRQSFQWSTTWTVKICCRCPVGKSGILRRCPVGQIGTMPLQKPGAFWNLTNVFSMTPFSILDLRRCLVNDLSGHTDSCGSECKLFHLGSLVFIGVCLWDFIVMSYLTVSPSQWASPQLNGPVQNRLDNLTKTVYWPGHDGR